MPVDTAVFVPGLGLGPEAWEPTTRPMSTAPHVVVAPLPGYGLPADGADLAPRSLAQMLVEQLDGLGGTLLLAGHSASCQVVAHAARLMGPRVPGILLVGPTTDPRADSWAALTQRWLRTAAHETPRQVPTLVRQYSRTTLRTMARAMDRARADRIDQTLAGWSGTLLVVRGRHDRICPPDWGHRVARCAPRGTLHTLAGGGHMVPLTHGSLVARSADRLVATCR